MTEPSETPQCSQPVAGPEHNLLKPFAGQFRAVVKLFMGPGEPMVHTGIMDSQFQLDGLFLHQNYTGDPAEGPFPRFLGRGYWGYNTGSGKFEGFWIDNASTMMQTETGSVNESGTVWTMHSKFTPPHAKQEMAKRSEIRLVDADHHTMNSFVTGLGGQEVKTMEIAYTRV